MLKTIRVSYVINNEDYVTVDIFKEDRPEVLLWNNEGLYKIFPAAMFTQTDPHFVQARWSDGYQIPVDTAKLLIGE
jgi:hypothetical protein